MLILLYNCIIDLNFSATLLNKLESIDRRAAKIIGQQQKKTKFINTVLFMKKCIDKETCENFCDYFQINTHQKQTRNKKLEKAENESSNFF